MTNVPSSNFPSIGSCLDLSRAIVNDSFPGIAGQQGRILTNSATFTLSYLNSAFRTIQRRLRNEGVTFPIEDNFIFSSLPAQTNQDPSVLCYIGYDGYFNGSQMFGQYRLPSNFIQPQVVRQRTSNANQQFVPMCQAMEGLCSAYPGQGFGQWEWRNYQIWFNGSTQVNDMNLRFTTGQPPINAPAEDFDITPIYIMDCQDAVAAYVAKLYGNARGANPQQIAAVDQMFNDAIDEMALEYIRQQQTANYHRQPYGGSNSSSSNESGVGSPGIGA